MFVFFVVLLAMLVTLAVWKRNYEVEFINRSIAADEKEKQFRFLLPMGMWLYDLLSKNQSSKREEEKEWAQALYVREDALSKMRLQGARQMAIFWICLFAASVLGIAVSFVPDVQTEKTELERPEFGQTKDY